jgi:hypothetical protein
MVGHPFSAHCLRPNLFDINILGPSRKAILAAPSTSHFLREQTKERPIPRASPGPPSPTQGENTTRNCRLIPCRQVVDRPGQETNKAARILPGGFCSVRVVMAVPLSEGYQPKAAAFALAYDPPNPPKAAAFALAYDPP